MTAFTDLLANPSAQRRYLAVLEPYDLDAEAVVSLHYSEFGFTSEPSDTPPNTEYLPRLMASLLFERSLFQSGRLSGRTLPGFGRLKLINPDGVLDGLAAYAWGGRRVRVYLGGEGFALSEYGLIFDGEADTLEYDDRTLTVLLKDTQHLLDVEIQTATFAGTGNAEGGDDVAGKLKPFTFGAARNVPAVYLGVSTTGYHQFATHDGGPIVGILGVRDNGVPLEFVAATTIPGKYHWDAATGVVTLGGPFIGPVTVDVVGDRYLSATSATSNSLAVASKTFAVSAGLELCAGMKVRVARTSALTTTWGDGTITSYSGTSLVVDLTSISGVAGPFTDWTIMPWGTTAGLVKRIGTLKGMSSFDTASFTALDLAQPATVGLWIPAGGNTLSILDTIVNGAGCHYGFTRTKQFQVGRMEPPAGGGQVISEAEIIAIARLSLVDPAWKVEVKHRRNYNPVTEMAGVVGTTDRAFLLAEWRTEYDDDTDVQTSYPASEPIAVESLFDEATPALAEATRLLAMFCPGRDYFSATLKTQLFATELNSEIALSFAINDVGRYGLGTAKDLNVVTLKEDSEKNEITVELWG